MRPNPALAPGGFRIPHGGPKVAHVCPRHVVCAEIGRLPANDKRPRRAASWANGWPKRGLLCTQSGQRFGGVANFEAAALAFFFGPVLAFFLSLP
jgi:hypothetical protein